MLSNRWRYDDVLKALDEYGYGWKCCMKGIGKETLKEKCSKTDEDDGSVPE